MRGMESRCSLCSPGANSLAKEMGEQTLTQFLTNNSDIIPHPPYLVQILGPSMCIAGHKPVMPFSLPFLLPKSSSSSSSQFT